MSVCISAVIAEIHTKSLCVTRFLAQEGSSNGTPHHLPQLQQQGAARQQQLAAAAGSSSWSAEQPFLQDVLPSASARQPWQGHQQQQQQPRAAELSAAIAPARAAEAASTSPRTTWHSASTEPPLAAAADEPTSSGTMQQDLRFTEPVLESAYLETQRQPLARMDLLFVFLNLAATLCCIWSSSSGAPGASRGQVLLSAWGQWVLLPVAAVWLLASPSSYGRWREVLWVVHRLVSALHVAALVVLSVLQERGLLLGAASSPAGTAAAAAVTAAGAAVGRGALGLQKGRALALLAENLGLKVRLGVASGRCVSTADIVTHACTLFARVHGVAGCSQVPAVCRVATCVPAATHIAG